MKPEALCFVQRPTNWQRFKWWLFPERHPQEPDLFKSKATFSNDCVTIVCRHEISFLDRVRILFTGKATTRTLLKTQHVVGENISRSTFYPTL